MTELDLGRFAEECRTALGGSPDVWTNAMAMETIGHLLGAAIGGPRAGMEWVFANAAGYGDSLPDDYLRDDSHRIIHQRRIVSLAEMLYHFQDVEGIDRLLATLRTDTIESAFAELEAAKILYMAGLPFRFVEPSSSKGADYDVEMIGSKERAINCEMKCKLETTDLSEQTILETLKQSSEQLPRDGANVTFVKVPEHWVRQPEIAATVDRAVRRFFGQSRRIAAVVFHWQEAIPLGDGRTIVIMKYRHEMNDNATFKGFVKSELIDRLHHITLPAQASNTANDPGHNWRYFDWIALELAM